MRNLAEFPVTPGEIETCLLKLAEGISAEGRMGDMRPLLLRKAVEALGAPAGEPPSPPAGHLPVSLPDGGEVARLEARVASLEAVLAISKAIVERNLGSEDGYLGPVGKPATDALRAAIRGCGEEIVYGRGTRRHAG